MASEVASASLSDGAGAPAPCGATTSVPDAAGAAAPAAARTVRVAAVDLGATSGRVMAVEVSPDGVALTEVHRFGNGATLRDGLLVWDLPALHGHVLDGLAAAASSGRVDAIGIDTWGVDYGLLAADGTLLGDVVCYRDERTTAVVDAFPVSRADLYAITGIQHQRFNTVYQFAAETAGLPPAPPGGGPRIGKAERAALMPDLLGYLLTGRVVAEVTNASTTGLLDARTRTWSPQAHQAAGVSESLWGPLVEPGTVIGPVRDDVAARTGLPAGTPVIAVGSHDTASAVAAVPGLRRGAGCSSPRSSTPSLASAEIEHARLGSRPASAFISSGTWSLVGVELAAPVLTEAAAAANFTNEVGVDGTVRFLRNVMGLWMLEECRRDWAAAGDPQPLPDLLAAAAAVPAGLALVDAGDDVFLAPGGMQARIADAVSAAGGRVPVTPAEVTRAVVDSLAVAYADAVTQAGALACVPVDSVHVVGGGSRNTLLCQATADATGLPVHAGPGEATVVGNALIQARALGAITGDLTALRRIVAASFPTTTYLPDPSSPLARKAQP